MPADTAAPPPRFRTAGLDEAGRGPWAGPVIAAAVVLPGPDVRDRLLDAGLADSKTLRPAARERLCALILAHAEVGVGGATVAEIDGGNILRATMRAMARALTALPCPPAHALVDGNRCPDLPCPADAVVKGDTHIAEIMAASVVAKVTRDRIMARAANRYPGFGFETNQGYGTRIHQEGLARLGPTPLHRRSFAPVHKILIEQGVITL